MESVAETSEEFMDRYFNGDEFSEARDHDGCASYECWRRLHRSGLTMGASLNILQGIVISAWMISSVISPYPESQKECAGMLNMKTKAICSMRIMISQKQNLHLYSRRS